ncbi:MAG TPA: sigma-70 family RNA polymerase sigma factor [Bacillales bacterium]|nr:sigma-70 family RNA polymerase sigma factor [Bacillales bacterium]
MVRFSKDNNNATFSKEPSKALEEMMDQYGTLILRTAYFYIGDQHLAEDISQEVFFRAYRNWDKFLGKSSVKTWLIKITINVSRDKMRPKSAAEKPIEVSSNNPDFSYNLEEEVLKKINSTELLKRVLKLPDHYREVLYLYYYLELNTIEISKASSIPEGTVRGRLVRARDLLSKTFEKEEFCK